MPKKFKSCVKKVKAYEKKHYGREIYNPYAVCRVSTKFYGPTRHGKHSFRKSLQKGGFLRK